MEKLIIIGAGVWASEITQFVEYHNLYEIVGYAVNREYLVEEYLGRKVYNLEELDKLIEKKTKLFISISWHQKLSDVRRDIFNSLKAQGFEFANLIAPTAIIKGTNMGEGNWISDGAFLGFNTIIGDNNIILPQSLIGHHTVLGNHNALAGRACIGGACSIGDQNYIGMNATIFNELHVGYKNIIGAGAILKDDITDFTMVSAPESIVKKTKEKVVNLAVSAEFQKGAR